MKRHTNESRQARVGPVGEKVLLLLATGVILGLTHSPDKYSRTLKNAKKAWKTINDRALHRTIRQLYRAKLLDAKDNPDGSVTMILTDNGKTRAMTYQIDEMQISKMNKWDHKWRVVLFDIPERQKKARNALSNALKKLGFCQFQKSVWIYPFECKNEVDFIIELFSLRPYVRFLLADHIDNELDLKKHFKLL
ncbi:MAG: hypothetical protein AAB482_03300 [Patescibacteria group bacterium]